MSFENPVGKVLEIFTNEWNKQIILYGPPGTSKTYSSTIIAAALLAGIEKANLATCKTDAELNKLIIEKIKSTGFTPTKEKLYDVCEEFLKDRKDYKIVQFHPSYSYEDFVRGIVVEPPKTKGDSVTYKVEPKIIEKFCDDNEGSDRCVLIIDEINRAPLASVLGELIYGLEYRNHKFDTPYPRIKDEGEEKKAEGTTEKKKQPEEVPLMIPDKLYIIGTMNTADRSIGSMDYAVRRRFAFVPVPAEKDCIADTWNTIGEEAAKLFDEIEKLLFNLNISADPELDMKDIKIGHTYFLGKKDEYTDKETETDYLRYKFNYQIKPIYLEYIKDGLIDKDKLMNIARKQYPAIKENKDADVENVFDELWKSCSL